MINEKITTENFDALLEGQLIKLNQIKEVPLMEVYEDVSIEAHQANYAMVVSTNRVRAIGEVYGNLQRLEDAAKRFYEGTKATKRLKAGLDRDTFPDAAMRNAYAEVQAEEDRIRWESIKSIVRGVHIERSDLWDYRKKLETISKNIQAEIFAGR